MCQAGKQSRSEKGEMYPRGVCVRRVSKAGVRREKCSRESATSGVRREKCSREECVSGG